MVRTIGTRCVGCTLVLAIWLGGLSTTAPGQERQLARRAQQYKRVHQDALSLIVDGKADRAIAQLEAFVEAFPDDAESYYMLAYAHAQRNNPEVAVENIRRAIDAGLPNARFFTGANSGFESLQNHPLMRELKSEVENSVVHGPLLGDVSGDGVRLWVRTAMPQSVRVVVTPVDAGGDAKTFSAQSTRETDHTAVANIRGLSPETDYRYEVRVGDAGPALSGTFSTVAKKRKPIRFRIAFGGGAGYVPENERMWDTISAEDPDVLFLFGDNVYSDAPQVPEMQNYCYYRRQSRPEFRRLIGTVPVYTIWDDHDFGTNDCSGGPKIDVPEWKLPVYRTFRNNWANPGYGGGESRPGCYYDFYLGDVHVIMLDGRYYRNLKPQDGEIPTMLGPVQRQWLQDTIANSRGRLMLLCSPVPWVYEAKGDSKDTWNGFKEERTQIFDQLTAENRSGVVLMSADRHRSDLWKIERPNDYPLYEFNSSRLTNQHVHPEMKQAEFSYNKKQSFGTVDIDTTVDDPTITYRVMSIDGEEIHRATIRGSELTR